MDDLISRQAALDMIHGTFSKSLARQRAEECIKKVPSAQPEKSTEKRTETHACDLISRQAAIDALAVFFHNVNKVYGTGLMPDAVCRYVAESVLGVEELPSAQPEIIRCKDCEHWDTTWQNDWAPNYHYCPLADGTRRGDFYCADAEPRGEREWKR